MFDSDFDSTDIGGDDIEFLDTLDPDEEISLNIENSDLDNSDKADDGLYHATKMSEDEIARIDDIWAQDAVADVEPYYATKNDVTVEADVVEPYKAVKNADRLDMESDLTETAALGQAQTIESFEEQFAAEIDAMSLDDLVAERERLKRLSSMNDLDIFSEFDKRQSIACNPELFDALTKNLSSEQLSQLRDGLVSRDPSVMDYFGFNGEDDTSDSDENLTFSKKRM